MDIVLLPGAPRGGSWEDENTFPRSLLRRLAEAGEPVKVLAYLSNATFEEQSRVVRFLIESSMDPGASTALIVDRSLLPSGILKHPYLPTLHRVIVDLGASALLADHELVALEAYAPKASEYQQQLTVWTDGIANGRRSNVLAEFFRLAATVADLGLPELQIGAADNGEPDPRVEIPRRCAATFPECQLFSGTLTVEPDGRVIPCPRHHDAPELPDLGTLSTDSLESILLKKGHLASSLGTLERCRSCRLKSRITWPESRGEFALELMAAGASGALPSEAGGSLEWALACARDVSTLTDPDFERILKELEDRLHQWSTDFDDLPPLTAAQPTISIETPVIKSGWLLPCIESVLAQPTTRWQWSLLWDGGDERARRILEVIERFNHPLLSVYFGEGLGVARARKFLTERTTAEYILPLDDDDLLKPDAVERFLEAAEATPWAGIIRARRDFVDEAGNAVDQDDWFPFGPRQYHRGMTCDLYNHSQPYLISRRAYERTTGWEGFEEYRFAGEDCDIFAKIEEVAEIELLDAVLYSYRLSDRRTSHQLGTLAAEDMWRRLAVATLARRGLPLALNKGQQPFTFSESAPGSTGTDDVSFLIVGDPGTASTSLDIAETIERSGSSCICVVRGEVPDNLRAVIAPLLQAMHTYDADLVGPKVVDRQGRLLAADPHFGSDLMPATSWCRGEADDGRFDFVAPVSWLPAKMMLVRTHVFRSIRGLDAELPGHLQQADFCLRARSRGFKCLYAGHVTAVCDSWKEQETSREAERHFLDRWARFPHLVFPEEVTPEYRSQGGG